MRMATSIEKRLDLNLSEPEFVAKKFLQRCYKHENGMWTLCRLNSQWMFWKGGQYGLFPDEFFRANLRRWLTKQTLFMNGRGGQPSVTQCTIRAVDEVIDATIPYVIVEPGKTGFFWIDPSAATAEADDVVAFENGLLDVTTRRLFEHTPNWFTTAVLPYSYNRNARCPAWENWLKDISGNDVDWIDCLRLWFGYNMCADTSKQRFAHFFGNPRSGKGTTTRVMTAILGQWNCASPTLTQLGNNQYVLASLVGKLAAIVPDAVIGRNVDSKVVMETLSSVIGEDPVDINQKYVPVASAVKLRVRFTLTSNEPLKWPDPTNKLSARCLLFPFKRSYAGKENPEVERRIMSELPGIANWALEGLRRIKQGEALREPKAGKEKHELFSALDSPIKVFCSTCVTVTDNGESVPVEVVHALWNDWCRNEGRSTKGQTRTYVRSLIQNVFPEVTVKKRGSRGMQEPHYMGLLLTKEGQDVYNRNHRKRKGISDLGKSLGIV